MRIINLTHRGLFKHPSHPFTQKIDKDHKCYLIGSLIGAETGIKTIAAVHSQFRCWVKTGKARSEQMLSAVHPITDVAKVLRHVRSVPILLQKCVEGCREQ